VLILIVKGYLQVQVLRLRLPVFLGSASTRVNTIGTLPQLENRGNLPVVFNPLSTQQATSTRPISSHTWTSPLAHSAEVVYVREGIPPVPMRLAAKIR